VPVGRRPRNMSAHPRHNGPHRRLPPLLWNEGRFERYRLHRTNHRCVWFREARFRPSMAEALHRSGRPPPPRCIRPSFHPPPPAAPSNLSPNRPSMSSYCHVHRRKMHHFVHRRRKNNRRHRYHRTRNQRLRYRNPNVAAVFPVPPARPIWEGAIYSATETLPPLWSMSEPCRATSSSWESYRRATSSPENGTTTTISLAMWT